MRGSDGVAASARGRCITLSLLLQAPVQPRSLWRLSWLRLRAERCTRSTSATLPTSALHCSSSDMVPSLLKHPRRTRRYGAFLRKLPLSRSFRCSVFLPSVLQLCANLAGPESTTVLRCAATMGIRTLARFGIRLVLVYLDADLHYGRVREAIAEVRRLFPDALVAGGGWDLSAGVQRAVQEASVAEPGLVLHVEQVRFAYHVLGSGVRMDGLC